MAEHNDVGKWGEKVAQDYFLTHGYAIAGTNVRIGKVEIDLIVIKDNRICFVEVKTRSTDFKDPAEAIDTRKRARMTKAADLYVHTYNVPHDPQFDIFIVIGNPLHYTVEHIPDAFYPILNNGY